MKRATPRIRIDWPKTGTLLAILVGAALVGGGYQARAQAVAVTPTPTLKADFGPAFERFFTLGLPDTRNAEPVLLQYYSSSGAPVWLLEETDGVATILSDQVNLSFFRKDDAGADENASPPVISGIDWKPAKIEDFLAKKSRDLEKHREGILTEDYYYNDDEGEYGTFLLFAAHLHRRGLTAEANAFATLLFESSKSPETPVAAALGTIASSRYARLFNDFLAGGDWLALADGIDALATDFGTRWSLSPGGKLLSEKLRARAATPTPLALDAPGLDAVDQSLLASLNALDGRTVLPADLTQDEEGNPRLWILAPPEAATEDATVFDRLLTRGVGSVPLLVALIGDEFLLPVPSTGGGESSNERAMFSNHDIFGNDRSLPTALPAEVAYQALSRPLTRGEIALHFLAPLLGAETPGANDPARMRPLMKNWLEAHGQQSPLELARHYLKTGDEAQMQAAMGILIEEGEESDIADVEKYLLAYDPDNGYVFEKYEPVGTYLKRRGAAGKDFLAQYEAQTRKAYKEEQGGGFLQNLSNNAELKRYFAPLHEAVNPRTLETILDEAASGEKPLSELQLVITNKLGEVENVDEAIALVLRAVAKARDRPVISQGILNLLGTVARKEDAVIPLPFGAIGEWQPVLEIDSRQPSELGSQNMTTAELAAYYMDLFHTPRAEFQRLASFYTIDWKRTTALSLARARARVEGTPADSMPPIPGSEDPIAEDAAASAWKSLVAHDPEKLPEAVATLDLPTLLALRQSLAKYHRIATADEDDDPPTEKPSFEPAECAKLAAVANRIDSIILPEDLRASFSALAEAEGKVLDKPLLESFADALKTLIAKQKGLVSITVTRDDTLSGTRIEVSAPKAADLSERVRPYLASRQSNLGDDPRHAFAVAFVATTNNRSEAVWDFGTKSEPAAEDADDLFSDSDPDGRKEKRLAEFWKACDALLDGTDNPLAHASITFWAVSADALVPASSTSDEKP